MSNRKPRESSTREATGRKKEWKPASRIPDPTPQEGYSFRWIRTATLGQPDNTNVSAKFREGWEPVSKEAHPDLQVMSDIDSRFDGNIEVGGLLLCKNTRENVEARQDYLQDVNERQMESVDNSYLRESDPRMPVLRPERSTKVSFGSGNS